MSEAPAGLDRDAVEKLANELSWAYDCVGLAELEAEDAPRAGEHRMAAHQLRGWLNHLPREEKKAAFQRGWDRAADRARKRLAVLEALIADQYDHTAIPRPANNIALWRQARQDPRYPLVRRVLAAAETVEGDPALPSHLQELLALQLLSALRSAEPSSE
ncbi:hypothetical protein [Streptomyces hydrogenans]|uniref:hypothetical protein n=1 Tax=Streptomyces hydrogenans TaxID=1873719 RepID=UPI0036EE2CBA